MKRGLTPPPSLPRYVGRCIETSGPILDQFREDFGNLSAAPVPRLPAGVAAVAERARAARRADRRQEPGAA